MVKVKLGKASRLEYARPGDKIDWGQIHKDWGFHDMNEAKNIYVELFNDENAGKINGAQVDEILNRFRDFERS
jgi:hypothetical protein